MKQVIIICEGQTEQEFCKKTLYPHFLSLGIQVQYPLIKQTGGGIVAWSVLKKQINGHLREKNAFVTTLIDYYGTHEKHNFPNWEERVKYVDKNARMDFLEQGMKEDIADEVRFRFIPYIQLHEFEGLLFNNIGVFERNFSPTEITDIAELRNIIADYPNPELINDSPITAPSKRLIRLILSYNKLVYGNIIAEEIGLSNIRRKSPRFDAWLSKLEKIGS